MSRGAPFRCGDAVVKRRADKEQKRQRVLLETELSTLPPPVCTKPGCGGRFFIPHEDGWQCWNCMKIIYRHRPLVLSGSDS